MPISTKELFLFVQTHYDLELVQNEFWSELSEKIEHLGDDGTTLMQALSDLQGVRIHQNPTLASLTEGLFTELLLESAKKSIENSWWSARMEIFFRDWTQYGTQDISSATAMRLSPLLKSLFDKKSMRMNSVVLMVSYSPTLWEFFETSILNIVHAPEHPLKLNIAFQLAAYLNTPDFFPHTAPEHLYMALYRGSRSRVRPVLQALKRVLTGRHNNALAWHTALAVCAPEDPTIAGSWMQMSETFSALRLEPKDQDAWRFWHLLRECTKDDASGRDLLAFLAEAQNEMSQAFADGWSIVDALHEGDERYRCAAKAHSRTMPILELPESFDSTMTA